MSPPDLETLTQALRHQWPSQPGEKAQHYVNQFTNRVRVGTKIIAKVVGNYGTYTVSIQVTPQGTVISTCSCYIGKHGFCHHCAALAATFLQFPDTFIEKVTKKLEEVRGLEDVTAYLEGVTLESLLAQLKEKGISQKAFATSIGMSTQHLSAVKSSEMRNRFYHELGATKLACLWVLDRYGEVGHKTK